MGMLVSPCSLVLRPAQRATWWALAVMSVNVPQGPPPPCTWAVPQHHSAEVRSVRTVSSFLQGIGQVPSDYIPSRLCCRHSKRTTHVLLGRAKGLFFSLKTVKVFLFLTSFKMLRNLSRTKKCTESCNHCPQIVQN